MQRSTVKQEMIRGLLAAAGEKLPTSSVRRLGRTALTLFRAGRVFRKSSKRGSDGEGEAGIRAANGVESHRGHAIVSDICVNGIHRM